ncbi:cell division protein ZipA [Methylolobus aquaticus]|nr:cell division protein ZipA [Methylolobus aquaticus]
MDRETVRLILLIIGVFVIAAIYLHGRYGSILGRPRRSSDGLGELPADWSGGDGANAENWSAADVYDEAADDGRGGGFEGSAPSTVPEGDSRLTQDNAVGAPFLIQASVVARRGETFSGEELRDALLDLGLVHGEMDIFHRYDRSFREPLFSVASLVKPGTFPMDDMKAFDCPGVVFFFQPTKVPDPLAVFDDLFETSRDLAEKLDGIEWDEHREPLTEESVRALRERVEAACG